MKNYKTFLYCWLVFLKKARKVLEFNFLFNFSLFHLVYFFDKKYIIYPHYFLSNSAFRVSCQLDQNKTISKIQVGYLGYLEKIN